MPAVDSVGSADPADLDLVELLPLLARRELSAVELVAACSARVDRLEPTRLLESPTRFFDCRSIASGTFPVVSATSPLAASPATGWRMGSSSAGTAWRMG